MTVTRDEKSSDLTRIWHPRDAEHHEHDGPGHTAVSPPVFLVMMIVTS
jgi:hypothetical protein